MDINVLCNKQEHLKTALEIPEVKRIYIEADMLKNRSSKNDVIRKVHEAGKECAVALPYIFRDTTYVDVNGYDHVLIRSLDELECYKGHKLISDYGLYAMNAEAAGWLEDHGVMQITVPIELNEHELHDLGGKGKEIIVYGHIPMMVTAQCLNKNTNGCDKTERLMELTDRTGKVMKVDNKCAYCYNLIYNADPLSLFGIWNKLERLDPSSVRINLTYESGGEAAEIIMKCVRAAEGGEVKDPDGFTRGHFTRGVE